MTPLGQGAKGRERHLSQAASIQSTTAPLEAKYEPRPPGNRSFGRRMNGG